MVRLVTDVTENQQQQQLQAPPMSLTMGSSMSSNSRRSRDGENARMRRPGRDRFAAIRESTAAASERSRSRPTTGAMDPTSTQVSVRTNNRQVQLHQSTASRNSRPRTGQGSAMSMARSNTRALREMNTSGVTMGPDAPKRSNTLRSSSTSLPDTEGESDGEEMEETNSQAVNINRKGIIPCLSFLVMWVIGAAIVLFLLVYVYAYEEVVKTETRARDLAAEHARLHLEEVLGPAVMLTTAVQAAFTAGGIVSISDYATWLTILDPHFTAWTSLQEVEVAASRGAVTLDEVPLGSGSIVFHRMPNGTLEAVTDRDDCASISSQRGCTLASLRATESLWYQKITGYGQDWYYTPVDTTWYGISFLPDSRSEVDCSDLCWSPAYTYAALVDAGKFDEEATEPIEESDVTTTTTTTTTMYNPDATTTTITLTSTSTTEAVALPTIVVRAAIAATELQEVALQAEEISRGDVYFCKENGELLGASDLSDLVNVDFVTGAVSPRYLWELGKEWVLPEDEVGEMKAFVRKAYSGKYYLQDGYRVSAHVMEGFTQRMSSFGDIRLVIAIPNDSFLEDIIGPLVPFTIAMTAAPFGVIVVLSMLSAYLRFCLPPTDSNEIGPLTRLS